VFQGFDYEFKLVVGEIQFHTVER
jgi:hypothetical protein